MGAFEDVALDVLGGVGGGQPSPRLMELRPFLASNYIEDAAQFILDNPGRAFITTGFFIPVPYSDPLPLTGSVETDGPPGAYFLGRALEQLDFKVTFIADKWSNLVFNDIKDVGEYVEFPIVNEDESRDFANKLLNEKNPSIVIATERCGVNRNGQYLNGRGWDISEFSAKTDFLMNDRVKSVGIGDGGNEMGMGNFAPFITEITHSMDEPCVTSCTKPVLGRSSDWGCYAIIAALSKIVGRDLLPTGDEVADFIVKIVDNGVVTGTGRIQYVVDGRSLDDQRELIANLRALL
jgi:hypothetical protein